MLHISHQKERYPSIAPLCVLFPPLQFSFYKYHCPFNPVQYFLTVYLKSCSRPFEGGWLKHPQHSSTPTLIPLSVPNCEFLTSANKSYDFLQRFCFDKHFACTLCFLPVEACQPCTHHLSSSEQVLNGRSKGQVFSNWTMTLGASAHHPLSTPVPPCTHCPISSSSQIL